MLSETNSWEPEFRILAYYYAGVKKEMEGNRDGAALAYYGKAAEITSQMGMTDAIQLRAAERMENLGKSASAEE